MKYLFIGLLAMVIGLIAFKPGNPVEIRGRLTDKKGVPIAYATVCESKTKNCTVTDSAGYYKLTVSNANAQIVFSTVGYQPTTVKINGRTTVNAIAKPAVMRLDELEETAIGEVDKKVADYAVKPGFYSKRDLGASYAPSRQRMPNQFPGTRYQPDSDYNREGYDQLAENPFLESLNNPLSTFSIDVDAASYSNIRRYITGGELPPAGAVRIEEMVNYFHYNYPQPTNEDPFSINTEMSACPWNPHHRLALIGLQGKKIPTFNLPASNLVFLIDVSGSMMDENKLPLVKASMKLLVDQLREQDKVAIVVYAGNAGLVLPPTSGEDKEKIKQAIDALEAGGSTAGGAGIQLAYKVATQNFVKKGNNRVILCTDGDFNVGESSDASLEKLIERERETGIFLTVLGYGMGNYQDSKMQKLADKGNGNHAYIDGINEAKKVLVNEFGGTLFTIAKDVKLQIEFNPAKVLAYRLIGYENRMLAKEDFNDDKKDAGELGSGHTVTALYEIIPVGEKNEFARQVDPLKYQHNPGMSTYTGNEWMTVKFRYKKPDGNESRLLEHTIGGNMLAVEKASENLRFAAAVAEFGMVLNHSTYKQHSSYAEIIRLANNAIGNDEGGYRKEFVSLVSGAFRIAGEKVKDEDVGAR